MRRIIYRKNFKISNGKQSAFFFLKFNDKLFRNIIVYTYRISIKTIFSNYKNKF